MSLSLQWTPVSLDFFCAPLPKPEGLRTNFQLDVRVVLIAFSVLAKQYGDEVTGFLERKTYLNCETIRPVLGNLMTPKRVQNAIETIMNCGILEEDGDLVRLPKSLRITTDYRRQVYIEDHRRRGKNASNPLAREEKRKEKKENEPGDAAIPQRTTEKSDISSEERRILENAKRKTQRRRNAMNASYRDPSSIGKVLSMPNIEKNAYAERIQKNEPKKTRGSD